MWFEVCYPWLIYGLMFVYSWLIHERGSYMATGFSGGWMLLFGYSRRSNGTWLGGGASFMQQENWFI